MGWPHTFTDNGQCPTTPFFSDIPVQRLPNYDAEIINTSNGTTGRLDNRYRDCLLPGLPYLNETPPFSCLSLDNCGTGPYEMFFNVMDYGNDSNSIVITTEQVKLARQFLLNGGVYDLFDINDDSSTDSNSDTLDVDDNTIKAWHIALIIIGSLVFIAIITFLVIYFKIIRNR